MTNIGRYAFWNCTGIETLEFNAYNCVKCGDISKSQYSTTIYYAFPQTISNVIIGENVSILPNYFLYGNDKITELIIPNSVTNIEGQALRGCSNLNKIVVYAKLDNYNFLPFSDDSSKKLYIYEAEKEKVRYWNGKIILLDYPYTITPYQNYLCGVSFKIADNEYCLDRAIKINRISLNDEITGESWTLVPDENGLYYKDGLKGNYTYMVNVSVDTNKGTTLSINENINTKRGMISRNYKATQTTVTITNVNYETDQTCKELKCGVEFNGQEYVYEGKDIKFTGLRPNYTYYIYPFAYYGNKKVYGDYN